MREIKFRAWHNVDCVMYYNHSVSISIGGSVFYLERVGEWVEDNDKSMITLMQFTGLKDKNGKEIYEGDIVKQEKWVKVGEYAQALGVVKYKGVGFTVECVGDWVGSNADLNGNAEVIGNIYENSDLLP